MTLLGRIEASGVGVRRRQEVVRYGCVPKNESDFCDRCGASFTAGLPFFSKKEKAAIRARLADEWRIRAITPGGFLR